MAKEARNRGGTNICFDCKKACGGCSWSEIDPETKKPAYKPVKGWKAIKVPYLIGASSGISSTYYITDCPEFVPDNNYVVEKAVAKTCGICGQEFSNDEPKQRRYCYNCVPFGYYRHPNGNIYKGNWHKRKERSEKHKKVKYGEK